MKRTSALALVIAGSCLFAWPQQGHALENLFHCFGCFGHGSPSGRSTAGLSGCLFGHCGGGGGAGSRSATNYGYGRISRPRSTFVPPQPVYATAPSYPPVPVLGGVGGAVTAAPAMPVPLYTPPPVATAPIPSVPAPASVMPYYVQPMVVAPPSSISVPCVPCPCPAPVCVPCIPYDVCPPPCVAPVETCVPCDIPCDPCGGPAFIVPGGGSCNPCGPVLAPACNCGPF
jgi:hypothetical protein